MNVILIEPHECSNGEARITGDRVQHIRKVLKAVPGSRLQVGLLGGALGQGTLVSLSPKEALLTCEWEECAPVRPALDLVLAFPRPIVLRRLWFQLAVMGVRRITIVNADKVEASYWSSRALNSSYIQKRLREGLAQAKDTHLPDVESYVDLKRYLKDVFPVRYQGTPKWALHPGAGRQLKREGDGACLCIGPEGGWTDRERNWLAEAGCQFVDLGPRILRSDLACFVAMAPWMGP